MAEAGHNLGQEPTIFTTSFAPRAVRLPGFLIDRIPPLAPLIERLETTEFTDISNGQLPEGIQLPDGMPQIDVADYSTMRAVSGTVDVEGGPKDVEATAVTFRNTDLTERAFATTHDPVTGNTTTLDRTIDNVRFYADGLNESNVALYNEAMADIGPLALSGSGEVPEELAGRIKMFPAGQASFADQHNHEGGFSYSRDGVNHVIYTHLDNFRTEDGGVGRRFRIDIVNWSQEHMHAGALTGNTVLHFDPPAVPPQS